FHAGRSSRVLLSFPTRRSSDLTVLKGYQQLVDEGLVESRRGLGMFINSGARTLLLEGERRKFLEEEWPRISRTIERLGLAAEELLNGASKPSSSDKSGSKTTESSPPKPNPPVEER